MGEVIKSRQYNGVRDWQHIKLLQIIGNFTSDCIADINSPSLALGFRLSLSVIIRTLSESSGLVGITFWTPNGLWTLQLDRCIPDGPNQQRKNTTSRILYSMSPRVQFYDFWYNFRFLKTVCFSFCKASMPFYMVRSQLSYHYPSINRIHERARSP